MKRLLLIFALLAPSALPQPLMGKVKKILKTQPRVHWGVYAVQAENGKILAKWNEDQFFVPASNTKLFSTALALSTLGPDFRFTTQVLASGLPDENGMLLGDLVLYGQGDPSLSSRNYPYNLKEPWSPDRLAPLRELARQVKARNVRTVSGNLIGDDTYFEHDPIPNGWSAGDGLFEYGAPVSALSFNDNSITLKATATGFAFDPPVPYFTVKTQFNPGERTRVSARRQPGSMEITLKGTLKEGATYENDFAVEDPALFAALAFRAALEAEGITVQGQTRARHEAVATLESVELARRESPPLTQLLQVVDKVSQNLHAELVRRAAERKQSMDEFLNAVQIDPDKETYLHDGSGLSRQNLISPRAVVALLKHMWTSPYREQYAAFLPIGAQDGTLRRRFAGSEKAKQVRAKTGTLSHVTALGGYAQSKKYGEVIFQIVANNFNQPSAEVVKTVDSLALLFTQ